MIRKGDWVTFPAEVYDRVMAHARAVEEMNRRARVKSRKMNAKKSDQECDIQGFLGEYAFAMMTGLPFDSSVTPRSKSQGTDDGDFVLPCGKTIDVKTRGRRFYHLLVPADHPLIVDIYVCMSVEGNRAWFEGAYDAPATHDIPPRVYPDRIMNHVVDNHLLKTFEELGVDIG